MPLRGDLKDRASLVVDETPYFADLDALDVWAVNPPKKLTEPLKYYPSTRDHTTSDARGKLLLCHDFQGGYTELNNPSTLWYTFNYLGYCDTFVYFSHQRVTVPPSGWVTAAHRQGVKILGTLIFEQSNDPEVLQVITGPLPKSQNVSVQSPGSIALSPHYARILADLAYQRGFDGYLLNFESNLQDQVEQARALASWITILQSELQARIGSHAQTVWYDSVTYEGYVSYQERLDSFDLPFFIPSTGFFSDYHWSDSYLSYNVQYLGQLNPQDFGYVQTYGSNSNFKSLRDIFIGLDMYGRGTWYQPGFGCYDALAAINQASADLSVAIFAPGWTWENSHPSTAPLVWDQWFNFDMKLWVGPNDKDDSSPPKDVNGASGPICKSFKRTPPPNPAILSFHTSFCPGVGLSWYVNGAQVLQTKDGWTDLQKQTSLGDMLWPKPMAQWADDKQPPYVFPTVTMVDKSWNGGSCLTLGFVVETDNNHGLIPIQSFALTPGQEYDVSLICNTETADRIVQLDLTLSVDSLNTSPIQVSLANTDVEDLPFGWRKLFTRFSVSANNDIMVDSAPQFPLSMSLSQQDDILASVGLDLSYSNIDLTQNTGFSFLLGQMNVFPVLPPALDGSIVDSKVLWADFETTTSGSAKTLPSGVLTWDVTSYFIPSNVTPANDTKPPWTLQNPESWLPRFIYFNVYVQAFSADGSIGGPEKAVFMGTTGLDGRANRFFVDTNIWPDGILGSSKARLYVQGVTDHGDVLPWDHSAFVDIGLL